MADWPVQLRGVTESIVTTQGPNGLWNVAALGLHVDGDSANATVDGPDDVTVDDPDDTTATVRARTWGRTRTWRNFTERGGGYVQFTRDPVDFVDAALAVREEADPVLDGVDAWVRVEVSRIDDGESGGTEWVDWALSVRESEVEHETVPTTNRGYNAVVEATVAASRLDVESYDTGLLRDRLDHYEDVARRCGGPREQEAIEHLLGFVG